MAPNGWQIKDMIEGCRQGDRRAQHALFHLYKEMVGRLVGRMLGSPGRDDVQDVIQQAYVALFRSLPLFRGDSSFDTWVYRICMKTCTSHIRTKYRKRRIQIGGDGSATIEEAGDHDFRTDRGLERAELAREVDRALASLDPDRRAVLVLHEMEGKALDEIARILDVPVGTLKSRLFRARRDLCRLLKSYVAA